MDMFKLEVGYPGGSAAGLMISLSSLLERNPTTGISQFLQIYIVGRDEVRFGNNSSDAEGESGRAEAMPEVARDMDWTIHSMYKVWPTNYIAYDELNPSKEYSAMYSAEERNDFLRRFQHEREDIRRKALAMYAQPVINQRGLNRSGE